MAKFAALFAGAGAAGAGAAAAGTAAGVGTAASVGGLAATLPAGAAIASPALAGSAGVLTTVLPGSVAAAAPAAAGGLFGSGITLGQLLAGGSGLIGASGSFAQGEFGQDLANLQADFIRQDAERKLQESKLRADEFSKRGRALIGSSRLTKGTVSGVGTNLLREQDLAGEVALQREKILSGGSAAFSSSLARADLQRARGRGLKQAGRTRGVAQLLKTGGQLFGKA